MASRFVVRRGGVEDAERLKLIRLEALRDTPDAFGSTYAEASEWNDARWREVAGLWHFYLGEEEGDVVAMVSGGLNDLMPGAHWLYGMYVAPRARGTGLAESLVDRVVQWALGDHASELYLQVTESVDRARAFYLKMGFSPTGDVRVMDRDPTLRLLTMVKPCG